MTALLREPTKTALFPSQDILTPSDVPLHRLMLGRHQPLLGQAIVKNKLSKGLNRYGVI